MTRTRYWWPTASTADKLHQVKHAAEARLTTGETAILLGAETASLIGSFSRTHGISFASSDQSLSRARTIKGSDSAAAGRLSSWRNQGMQNTEIFDRLDNRREVDDGDSHELRF